MSRHRYEIAEPLLQAATELAELLVKARSHPDRACAELLNRQITESSDALDKYLQQYAREKADNIDKSGDLWIYTMSFMALVVHYVVLTLPDHKKPVVVIVGHEKADIAFLQ
jgi:hypothetical protein